MRHVVTGRANRGVGTLVLLTVAVIALAFAAPAFASSSPSASPSASEAAAPASPAAASAAAGSEAPDVASSPVTPTLSIALSKASVVFGDEVTVSGVLDPATADQEITIKVGATVAGTVTTDATGAYSLTFTPHRSGDVTASLTSDPTVASAVQAIAVKPKATVTHGSLVPFLTSTFVVKVTPVAYDGLVVVKVSHRGAVVGTYKARAKNGKATLRFPLRGVDAFTLNVVLPAASGLDGRSLQAKVSVRAKTLSAGSSGPYVKGMLTALQRLRFRVPGVGYTFTSQVKDSVMAFQKAYRLSRTYVFNTACWRKIDGAKLIKARRAGPSTHIEVDKGRQILMIVKGGKPWGIICVSTGATGNTPEGTFRIQQKHPYTSSGFGGTLVRTMGFQGDFALHGWVDVPPYPASHGCVRQPIWACYWTYDNSWVGETVYIYH
jgi:lipoprotein-anchoring transpeptidase ErfK/SrfK